MPDTARVFRACDGAQHESQHEPQLDTRGEHPTNEHGSREEDDDELEDDEDDGLLLNGDDDELEREHVLLVIRSGIYAMR